MSCGVLGRIAAAAAAVPAALRSFKLSNTLNIIYTYLVQFRTFLQVAVVAVLYIPEEGVKPVL